MSLWKYGSAHKTYPVSPGDVWVVGPATFVCGDLEGDDFIFRRQIERLSPSLMFTDPPWDDRIATQFRSKSGLDENPRDVDVSRVICKVLSYAKELNVLALMEGGHKRRQLNHDCVAYVGGVVADEWTITYTDRKMPCALFAVDFRKEPKRDWPDFSGLSEVQVEDLVMSSYKPSCVIDPCGGLGGTAEAAANAGCRSLSHELSPFKMAAAIKRLAKFTGETPFRL